MHDLDHTEAHIKAVNELKNQVVRFNKGLPQMILDLKVSLDNIAVSLIDALGVDSIAEASADLPVHFTADVVPTLVTSYNHLEALLLEADNIPNIDVTKVSAPDLTYMLNKVIVLIEKTKLAESQMIEING